MPYGWRGLQSRRLLGRGLNASRLARGRRTIEETNEKTEFDTGQPFLAIVPKARKGYFEPTHAVYLVNPLDKPLTNVYEDVGGFFSDDDGVIEVQPNRNGPYGVAAKSALRLETSSMDEFDEFVCWWAIAYDIDGETRRVSFSAGKGLSGTRRVEDCPILNRSALIVGR